MGEMRGKRKHETATCRLNDNWTELPPEIRDGCVFITHVRSSIRGRGHARGLMRQVLDEAKRKQKILILEPRAFDDGLTTEQLAEWYQRLGFQTIQKRHRQKPWLMAKPL